VARTRLVRGIRVVVVTRLVYDFKSEQLSFLIRLVSSDHWAPEMAHYVHVTLCFSYCVSMT